MKRKVGFLSIRGWALHIRLLMQTEKHLLPAPGDPPGPPGAPFRLTGLGPRSPAQRMGSMQRTYGSR